MTRFALLLRGINVGGKNKVVMSQLRKELTFLGLENVETYINSGNIFFETDLELVQLSETIEDFLKDNYPFVTSFALFSKEAYQTDCQNLPDWWNQDYFRKNILFYTKGTDKAILEQVVKTFPLGDERLHFGELGLYWAKVSKQTYSQTAYHKLLIKTPYYRQLTVRNANTFEKIGAFLNHNT